MRKTKSINAVTTGAAGASALRVAGDITADLCVGQRLIVNDSTANDGQYTVRSGSAYVAPNTTVNVDEAVSDATVDGEILLTALICRDAKYAAGSDLYVRVLGKTGSQRGLVLDFSDWTYKTLAASTTPYKTLTERTANDGTGHSTYDVVLPLSRLNPTGERREYSLLVFDNATPAGADVSVTELAGEAVQFSRPADLDVRVRGTLTELENANAQLCVWIEYAGEKIDISNVDAAATARVMIREHGTTALAIDTDALGTVWTIRDDTFEGVLTTPGLTENVHNVLEIEITENNIRHEASYPMPTWGA